MLTDEAVVNLLNKMDDSLAMIQTVTDVLICAAKTGEPVPEHWSRCLGLAAEQIREEIKPLENQRRNLSKSLIIKQAE